MRSVAPLPRAVLPTTRAMQAEALALCTGALARAILPSPSDARARLHERPRFSRYPTIGTWLWPRGPTPPNRPASTGRDELLHPVPAPWRLDFVLPGLVFARRVWPGRTGDLLASKPASLNHTQLRSL